MGVAGALVRRAMTPAGGEQGAIGGLVLDLTRSRKELLAENALLRNQLLVAVRKVKRPKLRTADRIVLVGLAAMLARWRNALVLVQPETLLRWHRDLFRRFGSRRTKPKKPPRRRLAARSSRSSNAWPRRTELGAPSVFAASCKSSVSTSPKAPSSDI
jgi:hypothetical protein